MKRLLFTLLACLSLSTAFAQAPKSQVPLADPYIYYEDGTYYLYGTHSPKGICVMLSKNLTDWYTPDGSESYLALHKDNTYGDKSFWAPEVYKVKGKYIMFYSSNLHVCMAEADSPLGPFVNDGKPITEEGGIDNSLFIDDDGTPYLFWVRFENGNVVYMAEMTPDFKSIKPETVKFVLKAEEPWELEMNNIAEGPFCIKHNGTYYLTYSANDCWSQGYGVGCATTRSLKKPKWTKYADNPLFQRPEGLVGVGHHSFFIDRDGRRCMVFHAHKSAVEMNPRMTHITTYSFVKQPNGPDKLVICPDYFTCYRK